MGVRYLIFRLFYIIKSKIGYLKLTFPSNPKFVKFISLEEWKNNLPPFFFEGKNINGLVKFPDPLLRANFEEIKNGNFVFFNHQKVHLPKDYDWITNPINGFKYDIKKHWSQINDFSKSSGDIKYVWEKSRFSYLYDIIRYDYHFSDDQSEFVIDEILDFIEKNPINKGPNYKCSQEISIRLFNWIFTLYYYKDSKNLTSKKFNIIINSIFWQTHHVFKNIKFSKICVRNNHAVTETLLLYVISKVFPFFKNSEKWGVKGKKWFEEEIDYQIYDDGTHLQFSMNYHRVVIQLITWAIRISKLNKDSFAEKVYKKAKSSLIFLDTCKDIKSGKLPNYGSNDGALFFKLTSDDYRIYTSQLEDLRAVLTGSVYQECESTFWYGVHPKLISLDIKLGTKRFDKSGYYIFDEENCKTFIRCGSYKNRPFQCDNLHLDIWIKGKNFLRDSGSYKYNTNQEYTEFFTGNEGHNVPSVNGKNQMERGVRFVWSRWVKNSEATISVKENRLEFIGVINTSHAKYKRSITKEENINRWVIVDECTCRDFDKFLQYWHVPIELDDLINLTSVDSEDNSLSIKKEQKWFSQYYGVLEESIRYTIISDSKLIKTTIEIK